jgi:hypothetical protein
LPNRRTAPPLLVPTDSPLSSGRRRTLFSVPFKSRMTDEDASRLHTSLELETYLTPKPGVSAVGPGVARLDFWSGLFLEHGPRDGGWVLEGRTWGSPPESLVHEWHIRAAQAAKQLDRDVQVPGATIDRSDRQ